MVTHPSPRVIINKHTPSTMPPILPSVALPPRPPPTPCPVPTSVPTPLQKEDQLLAAIATSTDIPNEIPVKKAIGKLQLMEPHPPYGHSHDAIPLMQSYADHGCPVDCGPPWSRATVELLIRRGPHRSALIKKAVRQLRAETKEKVEQGYARVVKWKTYKSPCQKT